MTRPFVLKLAMLVGAVATAFVLTIYRPSPQGLIPFGVGQAEVRAAPGQSAQKAKNTNYDLTALKVFNQTLVRIRDNYVDPTRVDTKTMLVAALESVQRNIAEVLVDVRDDKTEITVTVNDKTQTFNIADVDAPWRLAARLKEIFRFIQANMNPSSDPAQIEYAAVNGMLSTLDPHSILLDPDGAREMDISTSGKFGGIGIVIGMRKDKKTNENRLTVMSLVPGETPASRAGLKPGDKIVKIGDEPTNNLTLNEAMNRLRGDPQTKVTVTVERGVGEVITPTQPFELVRDIIHVPSVHPHMLAGNIGYLKLDQFTQGLSAEMKKAMDDLKAKGAKAWILDLRGNPGGLLEEAVRVSDAFIDSGTLVSTVGYAGKQREEKRAQVAGTDHLPLAVLVSPTSASASEIVAGALKNLDRGVIIGQTSFGKGSVQVLYDYDDGSKLKLTIAQYLTPNDVSIQSVGITPDIELDRLYVPEKVATYKDFLRLERPINRWREADLEAHLISKNAHDGEKPGDVLRYIEEDKTKKKPAAADPDDDDAAAVPAQADDDDIPPDGAEKFVEDFQMTFARDFLQGATAMHRHDLLRERKDFLAKRKVDEEGRISGALAKLGIDWSSGTKVPGAKLVAHVTTDKTANRVTAGDVIAITGQVTNSGTAPAYQVHAVAKNDDWTFEGAELVFGKIDPGQTKSYTTYMKTLKESETRTDQLEWSFSEANGVKVDAPVTNIALEGQPRPQFAYAYQLIDNDGGNGDGLVQPGEQFHLKVTVKNVGKGPGLMTSALLKNDTGNGIVVNKGRFELKQLPVGETRTLDFTFDVKKDFEAKEAVLDLSVVDQDLREGVSEKLKFPVASASAGPQAAKGFVRIAKKDTDVREGADEGAAVIGVAKKNAVLAMTGKTGAWVRVEVEPGRPGFLPASAVAAGGSAASAGAFTPSWQVTPPTIALNISSHETTADRYTLTGSAVDLNHLEDVYILVSNRDSKIDGKKVFYQSNRGKKAASKLDFQAQVPLWPGNNLITVVARESNEVKAVQNVFVLKNASPLRTSQAEPHK